MTLWQALNWATKKLKTRKIKTAALDAEVLLSFVTKKPKEFLYTHPEIKLTKPQLKKFTALISRRLEGEPVAYLRKKKEFYGLDFYVDRRVLIPRPETELLVEKIIKLLKAKSYKLKAIADIGTGSGCIAITLAKYLPKVKILATDISQKTLLVARKNARKHKVRIKFYRGNLLEPLKDKKIDIIIANLPYGCQDYWQNNSTAVTSSLKFEPKKSIFTKEKGLYLYHCLFSQIAERKQKPKLILCEFDPRQTSRLEKLVKKYLPTSKLEIKKDLAGLNRVLLIKLIKPKT